jgi:hypothetical protein
VFVVLVNVTIWIAVKGHEQPRTVTQRKGSDPLPYSAADLRKALAAVRDGVPLSEKELKIFMDVFEGRMDDYTRVISSLSLPEQLDMLILIREASDAYAARRDQPSFTSIGGARRRIQIEALTPKK